MKINKFFGHFISVLKTAVTVLLVLMLAVNLYIIAAQNIFKIKSPTVFGFSSAAVLTGSMSGSIEAGDLIVTKRCTEYNVGDVITFSTIGSTVTHRITEKTSDGFKTKGDANNTVDSDIVTNEQIIGKVVLTLPKGGNIILALKSPLGLLSLLVLIIAITYLPPMIKSRVKKGAENRAGTDE